MRRLALSEEDSPRMVDTVQMVVPTPPPPMVFFAVSAVDFWLRLCRSAVFGAALPFFDLWFPGAISFNFSATVCNPGE